VAGRDVIVKMVSLPPPDSDGIRKVILELNGERWFVPITDNNVASDVARREKAQGPGQIGSPMPGVVVDVKVKKVPS
jgi:pyruvate carboxylase